MRNLNRILTWHSWGISREADPRHAAMLVRDTEVAEKHTSVTPGKKRRPEEQLKPKFALFKPRPEEQLKPKFVLLFLSLPSGNFVF